MAVTIKAALAQTHRYERAIAKMREHAVDGQNGSPEYALDRLVQIQKLADTVLRATDI